MDAVIRIVDISINLDVYLGAAAEHVGAWLYAALFAVVFCETGLVLTPFLPGDSLLFASGTLAGAGILDPVLLGGVLFAAAVLGDLANYAIGRYVGQPLMAGKLGRYIPARHLRRSQEFYERHGGKTIILARFIPFVRTFAPFVAGVSRMDARRFVAFNVVGAALWVGAFVGCGYFFGSVPFVRDHLSIVVAATVALSLAPAVGAAAIAWVRRRRAAGADLGGAGD
jgi:membrane-associated protein